MSEYGAMPFEADLVLNWGADNDYFIRRKRSGKNEDYPEGAEVFMLIDVIGSLNVVLDAIIEGNKATMKMNVEETMNIAEQKPVRYSVFYKKDGYTYKLITGGVKIV